MGRRSEQRQKARARKLAALQERAKPAEAGTPEAVVAAPVAAKEPAGGAAFGDIPETIETVNDVWLLQRAIRCEWLIPSSQRELIVDSLRSIVDRSPDEKMRVAAAKALVTADAVNVRREANAAKLLTGPKAAGSVTVNVAVGIQQEVHSKSDDDLRRTVDDLRRRRELIEAAERTCA